MEEVLEAAETAGLEVEAVYDAFTTDAPKEDSERLYYILRRRCAAPVSYTHLYLLLVN